LLICGADFIITRGARMLLNSDEQLNAAEYYKDYGYYIIRDIIPSNLIDDLLFLYKKDIANSKDLFFRQNRDKYTRNRVNDFGHVMDSFLDIHNYKKYPDFSKAALKIFCFRPFLSILSEIIGSESFNVMQTMLFDANTATWPHQDCWYLDSVPNGHLLGAWFALEDIHEEAGRFYVIPKTMGIRFHEENPGISHSAWVAKMRVFLAKNQDRVVAPELKKGDVLIWNSRTIHGSLATKNARHSRKSLTAHYLPSEYSFGNIFTVKDFVDHRYQEFNGIKFYKNQPDYSLLNDVKFRLKFSIYDSPNLLKVARFFQSLVKN
jgi:phytanoyl-CoA hydroxylase